MFITDEQVWVERKYINAKEKGRFFMMHSKKSGSTDRSVENFEKDELQIEAYLKFCLNLTSVLTY